MLNINKELDDIHVPFRTLRCYGARKNNGFKYKICNDTELIDKIQKL